MSEANFLDKLLIGVSVEWKALGELGELVRGNGLQKKDFTKVGVPGACQNGCGRDGGYPPEPVRNFVCEAYHVTKEHECQARQRPALRRKAQRS